MLRLYLLMRSTQALGRQYKAEIVDTLPASRVQQPTTVDSNDSPGTLQSPSFDESSGGSRKRPRLQKNQGQVE